MLLAGKGRRKPEKIREEKSLYPIVHVAGSLKDYQKELVKKEVASLWELSMVGSAFSNVLSDAEHFHSKLLELGNSFSSRASILWLAGSASPPPSRVQTRNTVCLPAAAPWRA